MKEYNFVVNFDKNLIISDLKNLVQNDYNTTKLKFTFDKKGRFLFKMVYPDGSKYVAQLENNELVFGPGLLNQDGKYEVEVALYTEEGRLTDFATKTFDVRRELVDTDELIKTDDRLPVLDNLIKDVTDIKTSAENGEFNGKDGITPTIGENGNWFMGDTDTGLPSRGEDGDSSGTVMILSEDDDATKIKKLLSVMEDGKVVRPLFYRTYNNGDEIPGIYELFQSYVDDSGRVFVFKCLFSNVYMVRFTVSSDNTLTKEASKTLWSDFVGTKEITGELENLSTEDKSNLVAAINEVANSSGGSENTCVYDMTVSVSNTTSIYSFNTTQIKEYFRELIQKIYDSGNNNAILSFYNTSGSPTHTIYCNRSTISNKPTTINFMEVLNTGVNRLSDYVYLFNSQFVIVCQWNEDTVNVTRIDRYMTGVNLLSTTNTKEFTPTASTHPATKGYVDTITGSLENLSTEDKSSLVNAINEVANSSGNGITELTESTVVLSNLTDGIYFLNPNVNIQYGGTNSYTTGLSNGKYILNVFSYNGKKRAYFINRNNEMIFFNESTSKYKTYSFDTFLTTTTGASKTYVDGLVGDISTVLATLTTVSEVSE